MGIRPRQDVDQTEVCVNKWSWKRKTTLGVMTLAWLSVLEIRTMCAQEERARSAQSSPFTASLPSSGLVHISRARPGNSGHRPRLPQRTRASHHASQTGATRYPEGAAHCRKLADGPSWIRRPGFGSRRPPTACFGMGWLAQDQDLDVCTCCRRRVGELVRARRRLLWRLRLAHFSLRPIETPRR